MRSRRTPLNKIPIKTRGVTLIIEAKQGGLNAPGGVLDFGLDGGVPPGPRDPNPCLEVKKVPMFRDFAQKMDPCLGIFKNFLGSRCEPRKFLWFSRKMDPCLGIWGSKWDPCLGIFCQKPTHLSGTSPYSVSMEVPPRDWTFETAVSKWRSDWPQAVCADLPLSPSFFKQQAHVVIAKT